MNNGPSRTSQAVALIRADLDRPHSPDGDPAAQRGLCAGLDLIPPDRLRPSIEMRTRYMDGHVTAAIAAGVRQIVVCGAGLDDRALRFRTPGVRFFEVDHPATQADKAVRLAALGAGPAADEASPVLVSCDFESGDVAAALRAHGHRAADATLFLCEGLLVYLGRDTCERLLASLAAVAGPGSALAVTLATFDSDEPVAVVVADANSRRRTAATEPWRTILPADEHLAMLADAGWQVTNITDSPPAGTDVSHGRRSLLVSAEPAARR
jgi:methyltransferase (TIGR00027 family)